MRHPEHTEHAGPPKASCEIGGLAQEDVALAARVLARAFRDNPGVVAILQGFSPEGREQALETCFPGFVRSMLRYGVVESVRYNGAIAGVSLLYAPGTFPPPLFATVIQAGGPLRVGIGASVRMLRSDIEMHNLHPRFPHWYVWWIGIDPELQGRGYGGMLMRSLGRKADDAGVGCYLETDKLSNVRFYESFGYRVHASVVLSSQVKLWLMLRPIAER